MNGEINNKENKLIINAAYFYITIPFIIFAIGWIRWYYSIIIVSAVILSLYMVISNTNPIWFPANNKANIIKIIVILIIISICIFLSGIGKLAWQNFDHETRNTIFRILVNDKWPLVSYEWNLNGSALIYYIGFWLPSAVIGKITNVNIGFYFQVFWSILGVFLLYMLICSWQKKLLIWPLILFLFFSGLDIIGVFVKSINYGFEEVTFISHLEWWAGTFQYTSTMAQLFWVFNQSIPAWLITILIIVQEKAHNLVFLLSLTILSSALPFIGLIPIVIFFIFNKCSIEKKDLSKDNINNTIKRLVEEVCSFQNVVGGGIIGIISFLYLRGNSASQYINLVDFNISTFLVYYLFLYLEVGVYLTYIYKYQKNNGLFYLVGVCLCVFPFIMVGTSADFCMRVSIPAIFILVLFIIDTILKAQQAKDKKTLIILILFLIIGSITPIFEINRTVYKTITAIKTVGIVNNYEDSREEVYSSLNVSGVKYSGDIKDNIFFEFLSK